MNHDQNYKNLILDYPRQALSFFAGAEMAGLPDAPRILPVRQEQLKERLGDRFRELDTPLLVEWPDGRREAMLFLIEEQTAPRRFSIHRLAHYCLDMAELLKTTNVVPVVIFLRSGSYPLQLQLQGKLAVYMSFSYIACDLSQLPADRFLRSDNIVARLNLPNMSYEPSRRVEIYAHAQDGLASLEPDPEKRLKYIDFIDQYAGLSKEERREFRDVYLPNSEQREVIMGLLQDSRQQGVQEGLKEGLQEGLQQGEHRRAREDVIVILEARFGEVPQPLAREIRALDNLDQLHTLLKRAATADSLESWRRLLR